jgi:hypothetical protein
MIDDGSGFLSGMDFAVADQAMASGLTAAPGGGAPPGAGAAGGFSMSADEMRALLAKAKSTRDLISTQRELSTRLAVIDPPGDDTASGQFTGRAVESGEAYRKHLAIQLTRYTKLIEKLSKALGVTVETDQRNADAAKQPSSKGNL